MSRGQFGPASQAIKMAGLLVDRVEGEMVFGLRFLPPAAASTADVVDVEGCSRQSLRGGLSHAR